MICDAAGSRVPTRHVPASGRSAESRRPRRRDLLTGAGRPYDQGIVTVELVFGILIVIIVTTLFGWAILLFGVQISTISTAENIARQAARGDQQAVTKAKRQAVQGAKISIDASGPDVRVRVDVHPRPDAHFPTIGLHASAVAAKEPGEQGSND
jgi:type IV secretory pathway TrbD component